MVGSERHSGRSFRSLILRLAANRGSSRSVMRATADIPRPIRMHGRDRIIVAMSADNWLQWQRTIVGNQTKRL